MEDLERFREEIQEIDNQIFSLISKRMKVSEKIGIYKASHGIPIRNKEIEEEIITSYRLEEGSIGEEISQALIKYSCAAQEMTPVLNPQNIAVIGGKGAMGQWAVRYFQSRGHMVHIFDKEDLLDRVDDADVIVIATPIEDTAAIIQRLVELQVQALVFDIASLKGPLISAISAARSKGLKISSIHPMFGPDVEMLVDQTIVICGEDNGVSKLFEQTCAKLTFVPLEEHDRLICYISALTHMINYLFAGTLSKTDIDHSIGTRTFKMQLNVARRIYSNNPALFYQILSDNPYSEEMIGHIEEYLKIYKDIDRESFLTLFKKSASNILP